MKNFNYALLCALVYASCLSANSSEITESMATPSLSSQSKKSVALAAIAGAAAGFGSSIVIHSLFHDLKLSNPNQYPYWATLCTTASALAAAYWTYNNTPERHFSYAKQELIKLSEDELFVLVLTTEPARLIEVIKDHLFREKLPLYVAYKRLDRICVIVDSCEKSLEEVFSSERADLIAETDQLQLLVDIYLSSLKEVFTQLKNDSNFIIECNSGTLELIKEAQEAAAHAAESSAFSQNMALIANHDSHHSVTITTVPATPTLSAQVLL